MLRRPVRGSLVPDGLRSRAIQSRAVLTVRIDTKDKDPIIGLLEGRNGERQEELGVQSLDRPLRKQHRRRVFTRPIQFK
jgi:hypothetical protein